MVMACSRVEFTRPKIVQPGWPKLALLLLHDRIPCSLTADNALRMPACRLLTLTTIIVAYFTSTSTASIHLPLSRRGGRFVTAAPANLAELAEALAQVEGRYAHTYRSPEHNRLVRRWSLTENVVDDEHLLQATGRTGAW